LVSYSEEEINRISKCITRLEQFKEEIGNLETELNKGI